MLLDCVSSCSILLIFKHSFLIVRHFIGNLIEASLFKRLHPNSTFVLTHENPLKDNLWLDNDKLRLTILDCAFTLGPPSVLVLVVYKNMEKDMMLYASGRDMLTHDLFDVSSVIIVSGGVESFFSTKVEYCSSETCEEVYNVMLSFYLNFTMRGV